jgi:hypothetical protein
MDKILKVIERLSGKSGNSLNLQSEAARELLAKEIYNTLFTPPPTP